MVSVSHVNLLSSSLEIMGYTDYAMTSKTLGTLDI